MTVSQGKIATEPRRVCLILRRRSAAEQRVIQMIRGEHADDGDSASLYITQFEKLRWLAARNALVIQKPGTPYLSHNELNMLAWLAQAQRISGYTHRFHPDAMLTLTIVHCAGTLDALGIRLPVLAVYNVQA